MTAGNACRRGGRHQKNRSKHEKATLTILHGVEFMMINPSNTAKLYDSFGI